MDDKISVRALDVALHAALGRTQQHESEIIDAMSGHMRCVRCGAHWQIRSEPPEATEADIPMYQADDNAMRGVRDELARRGLQRQFTEALRAIVHPGKPAERIWELDWCFLEATAELQARAALMALRGETK